VSTSSPKRIAWKLSASLLRWIVVGALMLAWLPPAAMPVAYAVNTGFRNPTANITGAAGYGNGFEVNPQNAHTDDGLEAVNNNGAGDRHEYYNYGFNIGNIPANAIITGIEIRLDGRVDQAANNARFAVDLTWNAAQNFTAARNTPNLTTTEGTYLLGGPLDTWGRSWTLAELADEIFAVRITSEATGTGAAQRDFFLEWVAVRVYYATARLSGTVFSDDDANGVQNGAEAGLNNVPVAFFRDDGDSVFEGGGQDAQVGATTTSATGVYTSTPLLDGFSYWVDVTAPPGRTLTTPPEPRLVPIPTGADVAGVNFGYAPQAVVNPALDIAKTPDLQYVLAGGTVTFTIAYTNTGNVTLSAVLITDTLAPNCNRNVGVLPVGQSQTYSCNQPGVTGDFTNTVQIGGVYTGTGAAVTDTDTASVDVINPAIEINKLPDLQQITGGGTANFTIVVTNTGDVALTNVTVTDPLAPNCERLFASLAPGASQTYDCSLPNVTGDLTNIADVVAATLLGGSVSDSDTASVDVIGPAIQLNKSPELQVINSGATAVFTLTLTNTGDVALTNVTVTDPLAPNCANTFNSLNVGDSRTYTCSLPNVTTDLTNTATVTCSYGAGTLTTSDTAQVRVLTDAAGCPPGLTAFLKLNEAQPNPPQYADVFRAHNGVCAGGCPAPTAGRLNGGQAFARTATTGISLPPAAGQPSFNWAAGDSFAVAFWMKSDPAQTCSSERNEVIVGRTDETGGSQLQFWVGLTCEAANRGRPVFVLRDRANSATGFIQGSARVNDGNWHYLVAVRDGAAGQNRLYVDGLLAGAQTVTYSSGFDSATAAMTIGWYNRAFDRYPFAGTVDEVAVYGRALASAEIVNNYMANTLGYGYCQVGSADIRRLYLPLVAR